VRIEELLAPGHRRAPALAYFARNAQSVVGRFGRTLLHVALVPVRAVAAILDARVASRIPGLVLRGVSRDRLDVLGEEFVARRLIPRLRPAVRKELGDPARVVLAGAQPEPVVRALARHLGIPRIAARRYEFRDGICTGRLLEPLLSGRDPVDPPAPAWIAATCPTERPGPTNGRVIVRFDREERAPVLSVADTLAGRHVLLLGATGFIGKVWLASLLKELPGIGRVTLLLRPRGSLTAAARYERLVQGSPVLRGLDPALLREKVVVLSGDAVEPRLGLSEEAWDGLADDVDLVVNSMGVTDFTPDLRAALDANVTAPLNVLGLVAASRHAALLHLSTCFVAGRRGGRVPEALRPDYNPAGRPDFDAEAELAFLEGEIGRREEDPESRRGMRAGLTRFGVERAEHWGWPNTYTFTKSLAESLLVRRGSGIPISIVRPSIVETSTRQPFRGWNEGINTSAPLSYLLGTRFRQLPTNARKRLDVVPVDLVTRGMMLIAAALVARRHSPIYQLASSITNPCTMRRSIELTCLAHRKASFGQRGLVPWIRRACETVPVSPRRYRWWSAPRQKALVRALRRVSPFARDLLRRAERQLDRVEKLIELYEPFILHDDHSFVADRVELLNACLSPEDRTRFGYDAGYIDWLEYWIDIHIPALRKWSYPLLEGKTVEE